MARIFLSYAHNQHDLEIARRLHSDLRRSGQTPWLDEVDLVPGDVWRDEIRAAIPSSDYFIALLSKVSLSKRGYVQRELRTALSVLAEMPYGTSFLIPVRLDDCVPTNPRLVKLQWLNLFPDYESGFAQLLRTIRLRSPNSSTLDYATAGLSIPQDIGTWPDDRLFEYIRAELETEARLRAGRDYDRITVEDPPEAIRHRADEKLEEVASRFDFLPAWHRYLRQREGR